VPAIGDIQMAATEDVHSIGEVGRPGERSRRYDKQIAPQRTMRRCRSFDVITGPHADLSTYSASF
jgi:hypothetical protein